MQPLIEISESLRIFKRRAGGGDWKRYPGDAREICGKIVEDCWNGRFFQTSTGHFCQFYSRDFAWCAESLIRLGHGQRVRKTLAYALERFSKHGHIRGAITPSGKPFDFPRYAIDSVPYMIHTLVILSDHSLLRQYKTILEKESGLLVTYENEFLTTSQAMRGQGRIEEIDSSAAALILKSYIDKQLNSQ